MPLANTLRPKSLTDVVGQTHLIGPNKPISRIYETRRPVSMIFYGPPGTGKTTVATLMAYSFQLYLVSANGTAMGNTDIKEILNIADNNEKGILLYLDEIQYLNKKQQQLLLPYLENGKIVLIASTTENPYFSVYKAILSRCTVFEFKPVAPKELRTVVARAISYLSTTSGIEYNISSDALNYITTNCGGDVRKLLTAIEVASTMADSGCISIQTFQEIAQKSCLTYDRDGDQHYDLLSALQKAIRGSDVDASLHYAARLLVSGDLSSVCRRLLVIAAEDIGLAYPQAISIVKACTDSALFLGMPEAQIPISEAIILLATSPKSNSAKMAMNLAVKDLENAGDCEVPRHLQNTHCDGAGAAVVGQNYLYPHDYPNHYVVQQYMPQSLAGHTYYAPGMNKYETAAAEYMKQIKHGGG